MRKSSILICGPDPKIVSSIMPFGGEQDLSMLRLRYPHAKTQTLHDRAELERQAVPRGLLHLYRRPDLPPTEFRDPARRQWQYRWKCRIRQAAVPMGEDPRAA